MQTKIELQRFAFESLVHPRSPGTIQLSLLEEQFAGCIDDGWDGNDDSIDCNRQLFQLLRTTHALLTDRFAEW